MTALMPPAHFYVDESIWPQHFGQMSKPVITYANNYGTAAVLAAQQLGIFDILDAADLKRGEKLLRETVMIDEKTRYQIGFGGRASLIERMAPPHFISLDMKKLERDEATPADKDRYLCDTVRVFVKGKRGPMMWPRLTLDDRQSIRTFMDMAMNEVGLLAPVRPRRSLLRRMGSAVLHALSRD
jgi:hypothetical protein